MINTKDKDVTAEPEKEMTANHYDHERFLIEYGITKAFAKILADYEGDLMPMPRNCNELILKASRIQGLGMFTIGNVNAGNLLAPARIGNKRTPAGRFTNHSLYPNARFYFHIKGKNHRL